MIRTTSEHVLLIGDKDRQVQSAISQAVPAARVTAVDTYFDAIAELVGKSYTSVLAAVEPIERRPEAAVKTLSELAGAGRIVLFGDPSLEPLSQKMLAFGCNDYLVTPVSISELQKILGTPPLHLSTPQPISAAEPLAAAATPGSSLLSELPLAEALVDALLSHPQDAAAQAVERLNDRLAPAMQLHYIPPGGLPPEPTDGWTTLTQPLRTEDKFGSSIYLMLSDSDDQVAAREFLGRLGHLLSKQLTLQHRHNRLQQLAITDELTGISNARYFRHFLHRIVDRARLKRFSVTLLLFDIDNFKRYNDHYGHGVGDEILKQTAALMRRCCRDHDLVARLGGDEFAVVFWEKEGPRKPREGPPQPATTSARALQTPMQVFERFRRLLATQKFTGLGVTGQGTLTISAGMAVYPFDVPDADSLIRAADHSLMFVAKKSGKNTIVLVGGNPGAPPEDTAH